MNSPVQILELPTFENLENKGFSKKSIQKGFYVAYKDFRENPEANPLKTPSGKIEIYSSRLAGIAKTWVLKEDEVIHPLPIHADSFEHYGDPLMEKFPLQLTGFHYKAYSFDLW